jgi:cold shock CspA family protein
METERMKGVVFKLYLNRGFGFVRGEDGVSRFMHATQVSPPEAFDRMHEGIGVTFKPVTVLGEPKSNGYRAVDVNIISA